jgi:hypothetical protein
MLSALVVTAVIVMTWAPGAAAQTLTISPDSGAYATTQAFDLAVILSGGTAAVTGGSVALNGTDVTGPLVACVVPGRLVSGDVTARCPGLTGALLGVGTHVLAVTVQFADGTSATRSVTWQVVAVSGP